MEKNISKISPYSYVGIVYDEIINNNKKKKPKKIISEISKLQILEIISEECEVTVEQILSKTRKREVVDARYIYFAALKLKFNLSLENIGRMVGNRDHSTVMNGLTNFYNRFFLETNYKNMVNNIFIKIQVDYQGNKLTCSNRH